MSSKWTIDHAGDTPSSADLIDCKIEESPDGKAYLFTSPKNDILSRTTEPELPVPPFDFPHFYYPAGQRPYKWNIHVETFDAGKQEKKAEGAWTNNAIDVVGEDSGTWTAQSGAGGSGDDEGKEDAAAAYA